MPPSPALSGCSVRCLVRCVLFRKQSPLARAEPSTLRDFMAPQPCSETMPEIIFTRHSHCAICRRDVRTDERTDGRTKGSGRARVDWTVLVVLYSYLRLPLPMPQSLLRSCVIKRLGKGVGHALSLDSAASLVPRPLAH